MDRSILKIVYLILKTKSLMGTPTTSVVQLPPVLGCHHCVPITEQASMARTRIKCASCTAGIMGQEPKLPLLGIAGTRPRTSSDITIEQSRDDDNSDELGVVTWLKRKSSALVRALLD